MENWQKAQDPLKLLPLYDIPIIQPMKEDKKKGKRAVKKRNRFLRFFKKMIYYKPTTFIGTNLMVAALTVFVQNAFSKPHVHRKPDKTPIVQQDYGMSTNIFNDQTLFTADALNDFVAPLISALTQDQTRIKYCASCGDIIRYTTNSGNDVEATCLACQKPFQDIATNVVSQQITRE